MTSDRFSGAWAVTEYVFDPDGTYRGTVSQRRRIEPTASHQRLRVIQNCDPSPELAQHPMAAFAGEWMFELELEGIQRRYLGPDVVGSGTQWQPGVLTASGMWPRFGYEFSSYSVLVSPQRQLTGGFFSIAGRSMADIVGVAEPDTAPGAPRLDLAAPAPDIGDRWHLQRNVGPLLVATAQPSSTRHYRLLAITDALGTSSFELLEQTDTGRSDTYHRTVTARLNRRS